MTVPTKKPEVKFTSFEAHLYVNFPYLMIVTFLIPLYKTIHMIVTEKSTKVRESLKMVGMGETAFWCSWLAYYTLINTMLSLSMWSGLMMFVLEKSNGLITFGFIWIYGQSLFGIVMIA